MNAIDLLLGTIALRPYVFAFLSVFLAAGTLDLGWSRTLRFGISVSPIVWLAEFSSTRTGIPFGLYHYTGATRGQELFVANVPLMDPLSFSFLAYASFCLARVVLRGRPVPSALVAPLAGVLMMLLDVVIDPAAVRGERWFLGRIFYYPEGGTYFGVPVSNFVGWVVVGAVGVGIYMFWGACREAGSIPRRPAGENQRFTMIGLTDQPGRSAAAADRAFDLYGRRPWPGIALYYAVLAFNLGVTAWIEEWLLLTVGVVLHAAAALGLWMIAHRPAVRLGLEKQRA